MREPDPRLRDDDVDRRFAEIVAGWHLTGAQSEANAAPANGVESTELDGPVSAGDTPEDPPTVEVSAPSGQDGEEAGDASQATPSASVEAHPAGQDAPPGDPGPTRPATGQSEDGEPGAPGPRRGPINPPLFERRPIRRTPPSAPNFPVWRGATNQTPYDEILDQVEDEDHFEPPDPRPLPPQEDLHFWGIIVGLVGGPLLLLWLVLFRPDVAGWWMWLAIAISLGGFVLLVLRGPSDDDHNNGAVV